MRNKATTSSTAWLWISLAVLPLISLGIFISFRVGHLKEEAQTEIAERKIRSLQTTRVIEQLQTSGLTAHVSSSGALEITVPSDEAMRTTEREAMELALTCQRRSGAKSVSVLTPEGQLLSKTP